MEKLAMYMFVSAAITLGLATLSYAAEAAGALLGRRTAATTAGNVTLDVPSDGTGVGKYGTVLAWMGGVLLALSLLFRTIATGHGPFANMHEYSISFAFGVMLIYLVVNSRYKVHALGLAAFPIAIGLMIYAGSVPSEVQPLVPALQNNTLLTLHVAVAILAYGAFSVSAAAAFLFLLQDRLRRRLVADAETLDELGYVSAALGFPFMGLVLILGAYWAHTAWGRYWGWDPKETASLVTFLLYTVYLHTRALRGWRGRKSSVLLLAGFGLVLFTYYGNLFFDGLHAYSGT